MRLPNETEVSHDPFLYQIFQNDRRQFLSTRRGSNQKFLQEKRIRSVVSLLNSVLPPAPQIVADIACGTADVGLLLAEAGHDVDLVDNEPKFFDYLKLKHTHGKIQFLKENFNDLPPEHYTAINFGEAIEHMADPLAVLKALRKTLRPGGFLCLSTPNGDFVNRYEPTWTEVKNDPERNQKIANTVGNHVCEFTQKELSALVKEAGFHILEHKLILSAQMSKKPLWRILLPKSIIWAWDDHLSKKKDSMGRSFGRTQLILAQRAH